VKGFGEGRLQTLCVAGRYGFAQLGQLSLKGIYTSQNGLPT
jgi:hypothetical protein